MNERQSLDRPAAAPGRHRITVRPEEAGQRIDRLLAARLSGVTRSRLKTLIETGHLADVDGATIDEPSTRVKPGQTFAIVIPEPVDARPQGQQIDLTIVHEDADLIVLDKPAGLVVHPAPGNPDRTLVNALIAHCGKQLSGIGGVARPGIVHRLDKDTSGLMVVAKSERAHQALTRQFAERSIARSYLALVWGLPAPAVGEIAGNIARSPRNRKKMAVVRRGGKPAVTRYRVLRPLAAGAVALVACTLLTGRTHQIRVHLAARGHPLLGDPLYGRTAPAGLQRLPAQVRAQVRDFGRQALHAASLGFHHPESHEWMEFESALPRDMQDLILSLESL